MRELKIKITEVIKRVYNQFIIDLLLNVLVFFCYNLVLGWNNIYYSIGLGKNFKKILHMSEKHFKFANVHKNTRTTYST